jgi:hypothetical protein
MLEALMLFEAISNSQWFLKTSVILFMNKMDLFRAKLASSPITAYFPDYHGPPTDVSKASEFFLNKFKSLDRTTQSPHGHYTYHNGDGSLDHLGGLNTSSSFSNKMGANSGGGRESRRGTDAGIDSPKAKLVSSGGSGGLIGAGSSSDNSKKQVYSHFTNATDTDLLKKTMDNVRDIIVHTQLRNLMF